MMDVRTGRGHVSGERRETDEGAVAVIVAILIVVFIGMAALAIDVGALFEERREVQTAADAGALAGVQELPASTSAAEAQARAYVALNAPQATDIAVDFPDAYTIRVTARTPNSPYYFARVWGGDSAPVAAHATARVTSPDSFSHGVMPIGVFPRSADESALNGYGYGWGDEVIIKEGGGDGTTGNFAWLRLGGTGAAYLKDLIRSGGGSATLGGFYDTEAGNAASVNTTLRSILDLHAFEEICPEPDESGAVHTNVLPGDPEDGCPNLILVPIIVNPTPHGDDTRYTFPNGTSTPTQIIGFAAFFVTYVGTHGGEAEVHGRFVRVVTPEEASGGTWGSTGLVHYSLVD